MPIGMTPGLKGTQAFRRQNSRPYGLFCPGAPVGPRSGWAEEAHFHWVEYVAALMRQAGFTQFEYRQTLGRGTALTDRVEPVEEGHGRGLFAVIKARKS
jgi:hypothetical protein